ncbi:hypothetical protein CspeluHIS016_0115000 [Cutaneotrichosporon spelunceum]|uniref:SCP domain-containing protein n=1 Tax=Cutaneotrichosporon spelunceum TaxID=1672016 RepID=A0AAD3TQK4_9TREE|nr:hypothetical protein CspeluHIS016_0115000 [Cutaneotrichosporon spelunceum]
MKASVIFALVASLAVPATAAPLKRDADANADADPQWRNGENPFGRWNEDGSFEFTINWSSAVNRWRTHRPAPYPTTTRNMIEVQPSVQPQPIPPVPQPQPSAAPAPSPVVGTSSAPARPEVAPIGGSPVTAAGGPFRTAIAPKVPGEPTLPFANDQVVITQDPSPADLAGTSAQAKVWLDYHNQWRAQYGVPGLTWDEGLAKKAADSMAGCKWEHIGADNLGAVWGTGAVVNHFVHNLMDGWAEEFKIYDYNNPRWTFETGHFSAMTWRAVTKMGCGWKLGCKDSSPGVGKEKKIYYSCVYDPAPNTEGWTPEETRQHFVDNVPRYTGP